MKGTGRIARPKGRTSHCIGASWEIIWLVRRPGEGAGTADEVRHFVALRDLTGILFLLLYNRFASFVLGLPVVLLFFPFSLFLGLSFLFLPSSLKLSRRHTCNLLITPRFFYDINLFLVPLLCCLLPSPSTLIYLFIPRRLSFPISMPSPVLAKRSATAGIRFVCLVIDILL